ncbi:MAG: mechanosensitive ion channel family protein [Flammeovirgaceae bacterium]
MFEDFFTKEYYGNTIGKWLLASLIIIASIALGRAIYWFFKNVLQRLTRKTASKLDDIIIEQVEGPVAFAIIIFGIWQALFQTLYFEPHVHNWIGRVYYILIIFNIAWLINRLFDSIIEEYVVPLIQKSESDLDDQLLPVIRKSIKITVWVLAVIIALNNAGYDVGALLAGLGIGGLAFALAAQDTVANLLGGFTIFADRPFRVKDRVIVDKYDGRVQEIGLRSTRIRIRDGRIVTIPNSQLSNNACINVSSEPFRKIVTKIGIRYDIDNDQLDEALAILNQIAEEYRDQDRIEKLFFVALYNFGEYSLEFLFIYFIKKGQRNLMTKSAINVDIFKRFTNAGLRFSAPIKGFYRNQGIEEGDPFPDFNLDKDDATGEYD